jgi:hypothetical protein
MTEAKKGDPEAMRQMMTEGNFREWLSQFSARQKVGEAKNTDERPLAQFMTERLGDKAIVTPVRTHARNTHFINPGWAQAFTHEIDEAGVNRIVQTRALTILDNLDWTPGDRMD